MGPEDEEEVGPTPSPGYSDGRVPVWREGSRTGGGKILTQESKHHFLPLSIDSQVCTELYTVFTTAWQDYPIYA